MSVEEVIVKRARQFKARQLREAEQVDAKWQLIAVPRGFRDQFPAQHCRRPSQICLQQAHVHDLLKLGCT